MEDIPEIADLKAISADFKNLGFSSLLKEEEICADKSDNLLKETEEKLQIVEALDDYIQELQEHVAAIQENIEVLDVEMIRTKTQVKKVEKLVGKLESMNTSQVKIDATEGDKLRMRTNLTKLSIVKKLTGLQLNKEGKGFITDNDGQIKIIQINRNNPKEVVRECLWNEISHCSRHKDEWQRLFHATDVE